MSVKVGPDKLWLGSCSRSTLCVYINVDGITSASLVAWARKVRQVALQFGYFRN